MSKVNKKSDYTLSKSDIEKLHNCFKSHIVKQTTDKEKLESQRVKFAGTCKLCSEPLSYITGNVLVCKNPDCKGIVKNEGTEYEKAESYFRLLDEKGSEIAENLFYEG